MNEFASGLREDVQTRFSSSFLDTLVKDG